jgi:hypothetical protein
MGQVRTSLHELPPLRAGPSLYPGWGFCLRLPLSDLIGAAGHGWRWRPPFTGRHMPINEPLRPIGERLVGVVGAIEHLAGDVL